VRTFQGTYCSLALAVMLVGVTSVCMSASAFADQGRRNGPIVITANPGGSWQLYSINPDGSGLMQITHLAHTAFDGWFPQVSSDGKRIAFAYGPVDSNNVAHPDVYIINLDGTGLQRKTHDGISQAPAWSPDGTRLVYLYGADTSPKNGRRRVIVTAPVNDPDHRTVLTSDLYANYYGEYAPDGRHIIYNYNTTAGGTLGETWIMDVDDGANKKTFDEAPAEPLPI
jgi:Tol biopolymer transport system component